jgi:hypothetical protein
MQAQPLDQEIKKEKKSENVGNRIKFYQYRCQKDRIAGGRSAPRYS